MFDAWNCLLCFLPVVLPGDQDEQENWPGKTEAKRHDGLMASVDIVDYWIEYDDRIEP